MTDFKIIGCPKWDCESHSCYSHLQKLLINKMTGFCMQIHWSPKRGMYWNCIKLKKKTLEFSLQRRCNRYKKNDIKAFKCLVFFAFTTSCCSFPQDRQMERVRNCTIHEGFLYPSEFLQHFPSFLLGCRKGFDFAWVERTLERHQRLPTEQPQQEEGRCLHSCWSCQQCWPWRP